MTAGTMLPELPAITLVETMFAMVTMPATDKSIPPVSKAIVWPVATTPRNAEIWRIIEELPELKHARRDQSGDNIEQCNCPPDGADSADHVRCAK